jgi:hypothetical protein
MIRKRFGEHISGPFWLAASAFAPVRDSQVQIRDPFDLNKIMLKTKET